MGSNVLVLGVDDFHRNELKKIADKKPYSLDLSVDLSEMKINKNNKLDIEEIIYNLEKKIKSSSPPITGLVAYWDFPVTLLQSYFCDRYGYPGSSLSSTLKCEHKYWSRLEQEKVAPEAVPNFISFDPLNDSLDKLQAISLPYWIKPVKSCSSQLAFRVEKREQEKEVIEKIRKQIKYVSGPISYFLRHVDRPEDVPVDSGQYCVVEECLQGRQATIEGYKYKGEVEDYAYFDSTNDESDRSFQSYEHPSRLSKNVKKRMLDISQRFLDHIGFDDSTFNIEFFYDEKTDKLSILEVNPRMSQSHTLPIYWVDGFSNIEVACDLAANQKPITTKRQGPYRHAGKFFIRHYRDAKVEHVPNQEELENLKKKYPDVEVKIPVREGERLSSSLLEQDSYSYELALLYIRGKSHDEILRKYEGIKDNMNFELRE